LGGGGVGGGSEVRQGAAFSLEKQLAGQEERARRHGHGRAGGRQKTERRERELEARRRRGGRR